ncbi:MAG: FlgD immunoglobulin-like domain containing protein [Balneolaceae bacterium]
MAENISAQDLTPITDRFETIQQNSITSLEASENALWIGPGLNRILDSELDIYVPQNADSVFFGRGRVFSLSVSQDTVLAGLGYNSSFGDESIQTAQGFYKSVDNGNNWQFLEFPLDPRPADGCDGESVGAPCDIEFTYGDETYIRTRITVPQQSPPFEVDFRGDVILSVNWASGLLRSIDGGESWERLILPPSSETELTPSETYEWNSLTESGEVVNRYDPRYDNNLLGFGLLIDDEDRVWVGTASGINISTNALTAPLHEIEWTRIPKSSQEDGLPGNWIVNIREQPETDRVWMSTWSTGPDDENGLVYTDNGGETFSHFLMSERVNDIGFFDGSIFVAADRGLFISRDDGNSWERIEQIRSANTFIKQDAIYYSIASTNDQIWVGTSDGLASSQDNGENWSIIRVDVPLSGGNIYQPDAPDVNTYAYPNPFSPNQHGTVRIKYEATKAGSSQLSVYDFAMNPVYTSPKVSISLEGSYEFTWDGQDQTGRYAASGPYIYVIDTAGKQIDGKILLID